MVACTLTIESSIKQLSDGVAIYVFKKSNYYRAVYQ